jgi:plasmid stability protein
MREPVDRKLASQQNGFMKTTLDLPEDLVREIKLRAVHHGQKLKDAVAELLRKGLAASNAPRPQSGAKASSRIKTDPKTGLPVILCNRKAPASKMTIEKLLVLEQETQTQEDLERLGRSL